MSNNNTYLLLFTIGPVQSFIVQARKTQDLYAGSRILSELAKAGIASIQNDIQGKKPIFPSDATAETVPNRFLCLITGDAKTVGEAAEKAVRTEWETMAKNAWGKVRASDPELKAMFDAQVNDFLDINWAAIPFDEQKDDYKSNYKSKYKQLESQLGALKNARTWSQLDEPAGRKSSLSGEMNALFYNFKKGDKFIVDNALCLQGKKSQRNQYLLTEGEGLSAIDLIKRTFKKDNEKPFPSTARIALLHLLREDHAAFMNYARLVEYSLDIDIEDNEQLYFKENITNEKYITNQYKKEIDILGKWADNKKTVQDAHLCLIEKLKTDIADKMSSYYAVLRFDGDDMGKWLGGEYLKDEKQLQDFHQKLSELLSSFAKKTKDDIDNNKLGQTIYAGGDDFLAFLNLKDLFTTLQKIRNDFKTEVSDKLTEYKKDTNNELTFSASVVIAHYKHPLGDVMRQSQETEKKAKKVSGKDACCVAALKASGEIVETVFRWKNTTNTNAEICTWIETLLGSLKNDKLSPNFIKVLQNEMTYFEGMNISNIDSIMKGSEIKRTMTRAKKDKDLSDAKLNSYIDAVMNIYEYNPRTDEVSNFISTLNLCDFLTRKI